jgi:toxin ParE1/3/4
VDVVGSPTALRNLNRIVDYFDALNPVAGIALARRLQEAGNSLASFPHRGRLIPRTEIRELAVVYPYLIRYRIMRGPAVLILRVRHGAQLP